MLDDNAWMTHALRLADVAEQHGEVPVGAVLVSREGDVLGEGFNSVIRLNDPSAHAEIQAIRQAAERVGNYRLLGSTLYVTLEPCTMCAGAIVHSRIKRLVFGAYDPKTGAVGSRFHYFNDFVMNHTVEVSAGVQAEKCGAKLSAFFQRRRAEIKAQKQQSAVE
ncbi:tRNA adenosine(34) deaminase TadA [Pasteurellaceae bacterium HPA106]|uniref:tRNA adenosine(34) deaminase TadA n=1 Tax=Spirabiliibacterium pneumoniae TaxID=221400 RepID=UPI001AAE01BD|nr:tRNA adenosine(34) deaminase TadA [Spirabiliibacterium pneumoniae]MBE2895821.1 tRNA adenosine(34) deaminase TadA [Spirabiliibacterium pneumoniae]